MGRARRKTTEETAAPDPATTPELRLEWRSPAELADNPKNWRLHPEAQQAALAGVMNEVGWAGACLFNERTGRLIDGHLRRKVAQANGADKIPVLIGSWSEADEAKILATLDPVANMAGADPVKLDALIREVETSSEAVAAMLADLWASVEADAVGDATPDADPQDAEPQNDRAAELMEKWGTKAGQLWLVGKHRLLIGDCRKPEDMARLCGGDKINVAFTSPPYASQRKYDESSGFKPIKPDEYVAWWEAVQANVRKYLADDGSFFVNIKPHCEDGERVLYVFDLVLKMRRGWGWRFVDELCWTHEGTPINAKADGRFKNAFEPVYHFANARPHKICPDNVLHESDRSRRWIPGCGNKTTQGNFGINGDASPGLALPSNNVQVNKGEGRDDSAIHAAKFPIGLPSFFIRAFSDEGDLILDPFMGSGTTMISAEGLGRRSLGCEISAQYAGVILQRYADAFPDQEIKQAQ